MARSKYPAIPEPTRAPEALYESVLAMKRIVETLARQRTTLPAAVTFQDLVDLGLISRDQVPK